MPDPQNPTMTEIGPRLEDYADDKGNVTLDNYERYLATKHKVPLELAKAIRRGESGGGGHYGGKGGSVIESATAGARGRYQVLPTTAKALGITNLDDPAENTRAGILELRRLHDAASKYTDNDEDRWIYATSGYFGGEGNLKRVATTGQMDRHDYKLDKQGRKVPGTSTFDYVQGVIDRTKQLRAAGEGSDAAEGISNFFTGAAREQKAPTTAPTPAAAAPPKAATPAATPPPAWQGDPREKPLEGSALGEMYRRLAKGYSRGGPAQPPMPFNPPPKQVGGYNQQKQSVYDFDVSPKEPQKKGGSAFGAPPPSKTPYADAQRQSLLDALNPNVTRGGIYSGTPEQQAEIKSGKGRLTQLSQSLKNLRPIDELKKEKAAEQAAAKKQLDAFRLTASHNRLGIVPPKGPTEQVPSGEAAYRAYGTPGWAGPPGVTPSDLPQTVLRQGWEPPDKPVHSMADTIRQRSGLGMVTRALQAEDALEQQVKQEHAGIWEAGQLEGEARDWRMVMNTAPVGTSAYQHAEKEVNRLEAQAYIKALEGEHLGYWGDLVHGVSGVVRDMPAMIAGSAAGSAAGGALGTVVPGVGNVAGATIGEVVGGTGTMAARQNWKEHPIQAGWETSTVPFGWGAGNIASRTLGRVAPKLLSGPLKRFAPAVAGMLGGAFEEGIPAAVVEYMQSGNLHEAVKQGSQEALIGGAMGVRGGQHAASHFPKEGRALLEQQIAGLSQPSRGETPEQQVERERKLAILTQQQQRLDEQIAPSYVSPTAAPGRRASTGPEYQPPQYGAGQYQGPPGPAAWAPGQQPPAPPAAPAAPAAPTAAPPNPQLQVQYAESMLQDIDGRIAKAQPGSMEAGVLQGKRAYWEQQHQAAVTAAAAPAAPTAPTAPAQPTVPRSQQQAATQTPAAPAPTAPASPGQPNPYIEAGRQAYRDQQAAAAAAQQQAPAPTQAIEAGRQAYRDQQAAAAAAQQQPSPEGEPSPYEFKGRGPDFLLKPEEMAELDKVMSAPEFGKSNKLYQIDEEAENVRRLWKQIGSSSQTNIGASPEILGALTKLGVGYAEAGIRAFPQWSAAMIKKAQELQLPLSWLRSELRGIYTRMGKELGVDLTPPEQVAQHAQQWELPEGPEVDELGLGGWKRKTAQPAPQAAPQAAAEPGTVKGRISRPGERPETKEYGQLADRLSDDLPFYGGGRIDRSVNLDPDVRAAVAKGLNQIAEQTGIEPTDRDGLPIRFTELPGRVPWEAEPVDYQRNTLKSGQPGKRLTAIYHPAIAEQRRLGGEALEQTHQGLRALMADRLQGQAEITSLTQVTPEDYVDWFNDNIPPTSPAWGKLRNAIEAAGLQWPENARKGHYAPEPLTQLPEEIDPTPELSDAIQGGVSPLSNEIRRVIGSNVERLNNFSKVYSALARSYAQEHQTYAKGLHHRGERAERVKYPDKNLMIMTALQAVHETGGNMDEAAALAPALGRWDTPSGHQTLTALNRLKTPEAKNVYQAMLGVANSPSPKIDPTGVFVSAINKWIDYHSLKNKSQAGTLEKWLTNQRNNASLRQVDRSIIQTIDHYSNDPEGLAGFMQTMFEVESIDPKASKEDVVNAAAIIQRENELEEQSKGKKAGRGPQATLPLQVGGTPTGVTGPLPGAQAQTQAAAPSQQAQAQASPIGPQRPIVRAAVNKYGFPTAASKLAVFRSEIKHMADDQLQNLVTHLGQVEPNEDNAARLKWASAELDRRQREAAKAQKAPKQARQPKQGAPVGQEPRLTVLAFIRKQGGIRTENTEYGSEVRETIGAPANRTGGILNSKGISPEILHERLVESGYLPPDSEDLNDMVELLRREWSNRLQGKTETQGFLSEEDQAEREQFRQSLSVTPTADLESYRADITESLKNKGQDKENLRWLDEQRELIKAELAQRDKAIKERSAEYLAKKAELESTIQSLETAPDGETQHAQAVRETSRAVAEAELELARLQQANFEAQTANNLEVQDDLAGKIFMASVDVESGQDSLKALQAVEVGKPEPPIKLGKGLTLAEGIKNIGSLSQVELEALKIRAQAQVVKAEKKGDGYAVYKAQSRVDQIESFIGRRIHLEAEEQRTEVSEDVPPEDNVAEPDEAGGHITPRSAGERAVITLLRGGETPLSAGFIAGYPDMGELSAGEVYSILEQLVAEGKAYRGEDDRNGHPTFGLGEREYGGGAGIKGTFPLMPSDAPTIQFVLKTVSEFEKGLSPSGTEAFHALGKEIDGRFQGRWLDRLQAEGLLQETTKETANLATGMHGVQSTYTLTDKGRQVLGQEQAPRATKQAQNAANRQEAKKQGVTPEPERQTPMERRESEAARRAREIAERPLDANEQAELERKLAEPGFFDKNTIVNVKDTIQEAKDLFGYKSDLENIGTRAMQMSWVLTKLGVGIVEAGIRNFPEWSAAMLVKAEEIGIKSIEDIAWFKAQLFKIYRSTMAYPGLNEKLQEEADARLQKIEQVRNEIAKTNQSLSGDEQIIARAESRLRIIEATLSRTDPNAFKDRFQRRSLELNLKEATRVLEELRGRKKDPVGVLTRAVAETRHRIDSIEDMLHQLSKPLPVAEPKVQEVIDPEKDARRIEKALNQFRATLRLQPLTEEQFNRKLGQEMDRAGYDYNAETGEYSVRRPAPVPEEYGPAPLFKGERREQLRVSLEGTAKNLRSLLEDQEQELKGAEASKTTSGLAGWEGYLRELEDDHAQKLAEGFSSLQDAEAFSLKWSRRGLYEGQARSDEAHAAILERFREERAKEAEEKALAERLYGPSPEGREQAEAFAPGKRAYKEELGVWQRNRTAAMAAGINAGQFDRTFPAPAIPPGYDVATGKVAAETHIGAIPIKKPEESEISYQQRRVLFDQQAAESAAKVKSRQRLVEGKRVWVEATPKTPAHWRKVTPGMLSKLDDQERLIKAGLLNRAHTEHLGEHARKVHLGQRLVVNAEGKRVRVNVGSPFAPPGMSLEEQWQNLRAAFGIEDLDAERLDADETLIRAGKMEEVIEREVDEQREAAVRGAKEQREVAARRRAERAARTAAGEEVVDEEDEDIELSEEDVDEEAEEVKDAAALEKEQTEELEKKLGTSRKAVTEAERSAFRKAHLEYLKDLNEWEAKRDAVVASETRTEEGVEKAEAQFERTFPKPVRPRLRTLPYLPSEGGKILTEDDPQVVALNSVQLRYLKFLTRLGQLKEAVKGAAAKAATASDKATTTAESKLHKDIWKEKEAEARKITVAMKKTARSLQDMQIKKWALMGYAVKGGEATWNRIVQGIGNEEGVTGAAVYGVLEAQGITLQNVSEAGLDIGTQQAEEEQHGARRGEVVYMTPEEEQEEEERKARERSEEPEHMGPRVKAKAFLEEARRAGSTEAHLNKYRGVIKAFSLTAQQIAESKFGAPTESKRNASREKAKAMGLKPKPEAKLSPAKAEQKAREEAAQYGFTRKEPVEGEPATPAQAFENLFKKPADAQQPSLLDVSDADIQKVRRMTRERALNAPVTKVFERAEWGDDIVNLGAATHEDILAAADIQSTPELESLGSYVAQANNAGIAVVEMALEDLGYMNPDADGLAIPLKAVPKLAEALRKYGEAGDFLARYMEAVVSLKSKGHEVYGDRIVLVNAADHIDSQHLYDNVQHELFHLLQFDMASEKDPAGLNRGQFVVKDPDYPVLVKAFKALGENTSSANIEIEAAGYIASGDWKAMGFQSADHAKAYLKRYIRHLVKEYGIEKLNKWPLMAVKGSTVAQAIREVQNEAKRAEKTKQKRKTDRTAAEEARAQAAAELGIELSEGTRDGEGDRPGSRRVVRELTKAERKARYEKRRAELAKLTPAERQAKRERARELREDAKEWRESLTPEERKAAWLERRNLIKNMTPEERADYDAAREDRRKNFREQLKERKGWEAEERAKERQEADEKRQKEHDEWARKRAEEIAHNLELFGTPEDPSKPQPKDLSSASLPPILNDPKLHPDMQPKEGTEAKRIWRMASHLWPEMGKDPMVRSGDLSALEKEEPGGPGTKGGEGGLGVGAVVDPRAGNKGWRKFAQIRQTVLLASYAFLGTNIGTAISSSAYEWGRSFTAEFIDRWLFGSRHDIARQVTARVTAADIGKATAQTRRMMVESKKQGKLYTGPKRGAAARAQSLLPLDELKEPGFDMEGIPSQLVADFEQIQSHWNVNKAAQRQPGETRRAWLARRAEQAVNPKDDQSRMEWSNVGNYLFEELIRKANQIPDIYGYSIHFLAHTAALTRLLEKKVAVRTERGIKEAEKKAGRKLTSADAEYQAAMQANKMQDWEMTEIIDQAGATALDNSMRGRNYPAMVARHLRTSIAGAFEGIVRPGAAQPHADAMKRATNAADYIGNLSFWRIPMGMVHKAGKMTFPFGLINVGAMYWKWQYAEHKGDVQKNRFKAQFIDSISDMVLGSGAIAGSGFLLGVLGMAAGGAKDWEEEEAMRAQGIQPFSINLSSFGRAHRLFWGDWKAVRHQPGDIYYRGSKYAAPLALAFEMGMGGGAALRKFLDGRPQSWIDYLRATTWEPTKAMATSMQEITALDRVFSDIQRAAAHTSGVGEWIGALATGALSQTVGSFGSPAALVQAKKLTDKYEREGRGESFLGNMARRPLSKLPGVSHTLPAKHDVYGQPIETEPGMSWWTRFVPGTFSRYKGHPIIEAGIENDKIPGRVKQRKEKLGQAGETIEQTRQRGEERGQRILNAGNVIAKNEAFKQLSKAEQDYVLAEIADRAGDPKQQLTMEAMIKSLEAAKKRGPGAKKSSGFTY